jgi:hypothetical protein
MDRRTKESKQVVKMGLDSMRETASRRLDTARWDYGRSERCRICGMEADGLPHAFEVNCIIDRELMRNATTRQVLDAVEPLVAGWPDEMRPTYAAVRNHAKHLRRDEVLVRELLEHHAREEGIDIDYGEGSILTPKGALALIVEKGVEGIQQDHIVPTVSETISASRTLEAIETERLRAELEEVRSRAKVMSSVLQQVAPEALAAVQRGELPERTRGEVVVVPESDQLDAVIVASSQGGIRCSGCGRAFATERGVQQHSRRAHG